jgi:predicted CoA-binding protein
MKINDEVTIENILRNYRTIAVVGLSRDPGKESRIVASYLQRAGYKIIPVNPSADEILGEKVYKSLVDVPTHVDVVDIFRPSDEVSSIMNQAIEIDAKAVWMQIGIIDREAAKRGIKADLDVVMDRCMMTEHIRLKDMWI